MKRLALLSVLLGAACAAPAPVPPRIDTAPLTASGEPATAATVVRGNVGFGLGLYRHLAGEPGNVFISPISIAGAFGPVSAGARGETLAEIASTMRFPGGAAASLHPELGRLLRSLERESEGTKLSIANALWVMEGFGLKPEFERVARQDYDATVAMLDFGRGAEAAGRINAWVSKQTNRRIPTLISPDSLDRDTALVVTNAVYFLGDWTVPFNASNTADQPFYGPGGDTRQVPLMARSGSYRYFETGEFQAIDLPYKDERLSMGVFLPKSRDGLPRFEEGVNEAVLRAWLARLDAAEPQTVRLYLPKLKIEEDYGLIQPLQAMGMRIPFIPRRADLSGIADRELFISQAIHKTFLRIDEKGTEAAAATALEVQVTSAPITEPPIFRADHPFFLVIRDKESGAVLFLGRIVAPERP